MKYIVYLTTNLSDKANGINKIYIGVHKTEDPKVFDGYLGDGVYVSQASTFKYPKTILQYAVKKYGVKSFRRETLYIYNTAKEAYLKEKELVDLHFISQQHTYNVYVGGNYDHNQQPLYQYDLAGKLIKKWEHATDAYDFYGYPIQRFEYVINAKRQFLNYLWSWNKAIDASDFDIDIKGNPLVLYVFNSSGKCIKEFYSYSSCEEFINSQDVNKAIKEQCLINKKYYISNKLTDQFYPKPRRNYIHKTFYVYDKNNKFYGKFVGKELMKVINLHSWKKIKNIFELNDNWYKDFYITLEPIDKVPIKKYNTFKVDVYDQLGSFIETIDSIVRLKEKYKISSSKLKNIQLGDKYFNNWIFKYHSK